MSAAKDRLRRAVNATLPPGSRPREAVAIGMAALREGRAASRRLRSSIRHIRGEPAAAPDLAGWLGVNRTSGVELENLHAAAERSANRVTLHALVLPGTGSVDDTVAALRSAVWDRVSVTTAADITAEWAGGAAPHDFLMVLRSGDLPERDLPFRVADAVWSNPAAHVVTWDDVVAGPTDPRFRPATWSPDLLLSTNPAGRSFAVRADAAASVGGFRAGSPDPWWDLLLRLDPEPARVTHLPRVLTTLGRRDPEVLTAMVPEVSRALVRRGWPGRARVHEGAVRIDWQLASWPSVSVIVPTRHNRPLLEGLLPTLRATDYPDWELVVVDNGGATDDHRRWYEQELGGLDARVVWWDEEPFNYSRVNNVAVAGSRGDVVVLLNDDTEVRSPGWLRELVGWATREEIGTVGVQLVNGEGVIQHGGVVIGMSGFADHLFAGLPPGAATAMGSTRWYRDTSACTAACVAVRREVWDEIGGLDERLALLGSDVVLGLDSLGRGYRNVVTPAIDVRHLESVTRGPAVPTEDMYASYWRYHRWLRVGDPYFTPHLSLMGPDAGLRPADEAPPLTRIGPLLGREFGVFRQRASEDEAVLLADLCRIDGATIETVGRAHAAVVGPRPVRTVNWFIPDVENPFYGGIATAFRIAEHLRVHHGVENRFISWSAPNDAWLRSALRAIFPGLGDSPIHFYDGRVGPGLADLPPCDAAIATQWPTAYAVAALPEAVRRFYLVQDFEPMFHPAGSLYALAEESYKLGLYGICNTVSMARFYREDYGGTAMHFVPAVDTEVFHARGRVERDPDDPVTVFLYARPGHWRNCWELVSLALDELKDTYGSRLRVVTAGSWARPEDLGRGIDHLGLLDYRATGDLYRSCDIGISLTVSPHPSYLPLELMACGAAVVAFDLPPGYWILDGEQDCLLARRTVPGLVEQVSRLIDDGDLRHRLQAGGLARVDRHHSDWDTALSRVYHALCDPEAFGGRDESLVRLDDARTGRQILRGLGPVAALPD